MEVELTKYIVDSLCDRKDCYDITRTTDERGVLLMLDVDSDQLGRILGKEGNTANSIRSILRALGLKNQARYSLKINERKVK